MIIVFVMLHSYREQVAYNWSRRKYTGPVRANTGRSRIWLGEGNRAAVKTAEAQKNVQL